MIRYQDKNYTSCRRKSRMEVAVFMLDRVSIAPPSLLRKEKILMIDVTFCQIDLDENLNGKIRLEVLFYLVFECFTMKYLNWITFVKNHVHNFTI